MKVRISLPRGVQTKIDNMMIDPSTMLELRTHDQQHIQVEIGEAMLRIPYVEGVSTALAADARVAELEAQVSRLQAYSRGMNEFAWDVCRNHTTYEHLLAMKQQRAGLQLGDLGEGADGE